MLGQIYCCQVSHSSKSRCAKKVVETIERQLSKQAYFNEEISTEIEHLMKNAPLTNSGCESHFAVLDWRAAKHGGNMPLNTLSDLQVVSYNRYLESEEMKDPQNLANQYKWARKSKEAKAVDALEQEFLEKVSIFKEQSLYGKEEAKRKKTSKSTKVVRSV